MQGQAAPKVRTLLILPWYRLTVVEKDPYELLGVPRDASDERIRAAYELEINRATRDGATSRRVAGNGAAPAGTGPHPPPWS